MKASTSWAFRFISLGLAACGLASGCESDSRPSIKLSDPRDPLPFDWDETKFWRGAVDLIELDLRDNQGEVPPERRAFKIEAQVLAWSRQEEMVPQDDLNRIDTALLWSRSESAGKPRWVLGWMIRYPRSRSWWGGHFFTDTEWRPARSYDHAPSNKEIYDFTDKHLILHMNDSGFFGPIYYGYRVRSSVVRERTWVAVVGEKPTRFFPDSSAVSHDADPR